MSNGPVGTTVILIRHAERDNLTAANPDPHLNTAGRARAQRLVHVLGRSGVVAIYTSHFVRTRETAQPLAAHLGGLSPLQIDEAPALRDDILANHGGQTVLVVGHSDTVPALINLLSGGSMPSIADSEFDNLFVVTVLPPGAASVTKLKYGAQS
jgi:broad specificity phosphatase PhoE